MTSAPSQKFVGSTASKGTQVLGVLAILGLSLVTFLGLVATGEDVDQKNYYRIMYVHVPSAWLAYTCFGICAIASAMYLWKKTQWWDLVAGASAEIGVLFTGLALATGMLWGKVTWGAYWRWDARLTFTALMFVMFLGYLTMRRMPAPCEVRAKRAAITGLIGVVNVPIVHFSVNWWRTLHQQATVLRPDTDVKIDGLMLFTLLLSFAVFHVLYVWLMIHRFRLGFLEDQVDSSGLELAILERQAEAQVPVGAGQGSGQ